MQKNIDIRPHPNRPTATSPKASFKLSKKQRVILGIVVVVVIAAGAFVTWRVMSQTSGYFIQKEKYQVVVLANNQIYFGKLQRLKDQSYRLTNVYYLQQQETTNATAETPKPADQSSSSGTPQLVKLGNELHGPDDAMFFNDSQVLYWENLKSDGKVSKSIEEYLKK
ncbi:MAG: hypothetical protein EOO17_05110 [Chloroflexi bacterium]|nr:MAG: hypothetical protein EOO17_05110 [Chloroflexota bacterium]